MASIPSNARPGEVPCPDPSVHDHQHKLSEQASTAALYATDPTKRHENSNNKDVLGPDGKLSSRSAAASLKYARPQDLPSYPSSGLGNADSAGKAAMLAKDYKMKDLWQPEMSAAASKAAVGAHKDGGKLDLWHPTASKDGNSAAVLAMKNKGLSPELDRGYTADGKHRALLAANLSVHRGNNTAPTPAVAAAYPDSHNASYNALNAATRANRANSLKAAPDGWDSEANQAARIKNIHVNPQYFSDHPPIDIDPEDTKHQAALRASAVSMAKQMYDYQNRAAVSADLTSGLAAGGAGQAARDAAGQNTGEKDLKQEAMRYIHLQDAAHKLAQERLAKMDKSMEDSKYREHYGYPDQPAPKERRSMNRLSMRSGRPRRRTGSESQVDFSDSDDEARANKIRSQMSTLNSGLSSVDEKKRTEDRARLMAAAEAKVHANMQKMDEKVFEDTGKVTPAMMEEWENKARERAQKEREQQAQHPGKTHIGGGKYIDQSEVEAIAAARLKPTLDEIDATAQKKRERDEEIRLQKDEQERAKREEKVHKAEEKAEQRRVKDEEKAAKQREKEEAKARKSEDKRKSREVPRETVIVDDAKDEDTEPKKDTEKRKSTLGRLFGLGSKKEKKPAVDEDVREPEMAKTEQEEKAKSGDSAALVGAGAAVGGVAGVEAAEHDKDDAAVDPATLAETGASATKTTEEFPAKTTEEREAEEQEELEREDELYAAATPPVVQEPEQESRPNALARWHTGDYTDAKPIEEVGLAPTRPNLEQHYSTIGYSDDEGDDEEEEDEWNEPEKAKNEEELAEKGKASVLGHDHDRTGEVAVGAAGLGAVGAVALEEDRTGGPHQTYTANQLDPNAMDTGPAPYTIGPHSSDIANIVDPTVKPDPAKQGTTAPGDETGPASSTIGPHNSNIANIVDPSVKPDPALQGSDKAGDETGPAPNTMGPHSSDIANIVDPRVKPEQEKLKAGEKHAEGKTADDPAPTEGEKKGIRGFFGRLKKKDSREPGKITKSRYGDKEEEPSRKEEAAVGAAGVGTAAAVADESEKKSTDEPSSKLRKSTDARKSADTAPPRKSTDARSRKSTDTGAGRASSDVKRGGLNPNAFLPPYLETKREGGSSLDNPLALGVAGGSATSPTSRGRAGKTSEDNEEDQFEEARDHFDESLAPPPAFAGQAKNESPHRETRFREEV